MRKYKVLLKKTRVDIIEAENADVLFDKIEQMYPKWEIADYILVSIDAPVVSNIGTSKRGEQR
jgi:hypothetical protein